MNKEKDKIAELQRVLNVIERIAVNEDPDEKNKAWMDVYMLAHSFSGRCGNAHEGWRKLLPEIELKVKSV